MRDERKRVAAHRTAAVVGALALILLAGIQQPAAAGGGSFATIPQDDCSRAEFISPDQPMAGSVQGRTSRYFRFVLRSGGTFRLFTTGTADTYGQLLDADCRVIEENDDGGQGSNFRIERTLQPGTYYISVRGRRNSSTDRYVLTLEEAGDDCRGASLLQVGGSVSGSVQGREKQYYRFRLAAAGICRIFASGGTDTAGELLDANCVQIERDNDSGGRGNFRIERNLQPGTYYIAVRGEDLQTSGPFTLHLEYEAGCSDAQSLTAAGLASGRIRGQTRQYYRFQVAAAGEYRIYTSGSTDTVGQLLDEDCDIIERNDDDGEGTNFLFEQQLQPGTYFVSVRGFSDSTSGPFTLHLEAEPDCTNAQPLTESGYVSGSAQGTALQFYRVRVSVANTYRIYTLGSVDTVGQLLDTDCDEIEMNDDDGEGANFLFEQQLQPGTYYVSVRGFSDSTSGPFTLHLEAEPDCTNAQPLAVGGYVSGSARGTALLYYRVRVSVANTYRIFTLGSVDTVGQLLDADCTEIVRNDDDGEGANFLIERQLQPGTYYVSVRGFSDSTSGPFTLYVERIGSSCSTAHHFPAFRDRGEIRGVAQGQARTFYRVEIPSDGTYSIYTISTFLAVGELLDSGCRVIAEDRGFKSNDFMIRRDLTQGIYYISVRGFFESAVGEFALYVERSD